MATITLLSSSVESEDGIIAPVSNVLFDRASIGTKLKLGLTFELSGTLADGLTPFEIGGSDFYFNVGAFLNVGQRFQPRGSFPTDGYFALPPNNSVASYPMVIQGNTLGYQSQDSGEALLTVTSATEFSIDWSFYLTCDILSYINGNLVNFESRLAGTRPFGAPLFENTLSSVYNQTKWLANIVAVVATDGTTAILESAQEFRGNFYNTHVDGKFSNPNFNWLNTSNAIIGGMSQYEDTRYRCIISNPDGLTPARVRVVAWTDADNWNGNWENTVGLIDFVLDHAPAGTDPYLGIFKQPSSIVASASQLVIWTTIDHTLVDPSKTYYIAYLVGYSDPALEGYQSFIEPVGIQATQPPTPVDLNCELYWRNLNNEAALIGTSIAPSERVQNELRIDRVAYDADIAAAGYGFGFQNDFREFIFTLQDSFTGEMLYTATRQRLPGGSWPEDNVFSYEYLTGDFDIIKWTHRIPGYTESPTGISYEGRAVIAGWQLIFTYGQEFQVNYGIGQNQMNVTIYENNQTNPLFLIIESTVVLNGSDGLPAVDICNEDFVIVESRLAPLFIPFGDQFNHVALVDRFPFGNKFTFNGQVKEFDPHQPLQPIDQLQQSPVLWCDETWSGGVARYAVDVTQLDEDVQYLFSALAIKIPT